jgi:shikimate dehydrogenase
VAFESTMMPTTTQESREWEHAQEHDREKIFTLDDLRQWSRPGVSLAVLGSPIAHSRSPRMHNAALAELVAQGAAELADWRYYKFEVPPERLEEALPLFFERGFKGLNLTLPHKVLALPLLARLEESGAAAGAVNTLVAGPGGYTGHNTDGAGFARALREGLGVGLAGAVVVLLGAGGAARAIAATALREGCRELWIGNRDAGRLAALAECLRKSSPGADERLHFFRLGNAGAVADAGAGTTALPGTALPREAVVINATSLGLKPGDPSPMPAGLHWQGQRAAVDIVYGTGETAFLRDARAAGVPAQDGSQMLCHQGALAFELWTGRTAPVGVMLRALSAARAN